MVPPCQGQLCSSWNIWNCFAPSVSLASPQDPAEGAPTLQKPPSPPLPLACHGVDTQCVMAPEGDSFFQVHLPQEARSPMRAGTVPCSYLQPHAWHTQLKPPRPPCPPNSTWDLPKANTDHATPLNQACRCFHFWDRFRISAVASGLVCSGPTSIQPHATLLHLLCPVSAALTFLKVPA